MKKAKKAQAREELDKLRRAARNAGLPEPECPEASISEGEEGEDPNWLNELLEEECPVRGGGIGGSRRGAIGFWGCQRRPLINCREARGASGREVPGGLRASDGGVAGELG